MITLIFQVLADRGHKVAIGVDDPALRIPGLVGGEFGFRNARGSQVVWRNNEIEVTAPLDNVAVTATEGNVSITAKGSIALAVTAGALTVNASGAITLTGAAGQIKANGNVLG